MKECNDFLEMEGLALFESDRLPSIQRDCTDLIINMNMFTDNVVRTSKRPDNYLAQYERLDSIKKALGGKDPIAWLIYMYVEEKRSCNNISQYLQEKFGIEYKSGSLSYFLKNTLHFPMREHSEITPTGRGVLSIIAKSRRGVGRVFSSKSVS